MQGGEKKETGKVKKMKDSGKRRVRKCAEKSRRKDALGLREEGE